MWVVLAREIDLTGQRQTIYWSRILGSQRFPVRGLEYLGGTRTRGFSSTPDPRTVASTMGHGNILIFRPALHMSALVRIYKLHSKSDSERNPPPHGNTGRPRAGGVSLPLVPWMAAGKR